MLVWSAGGGEEEEVRQEKDVDKVQEIVFYLFIFFDKCIYVYNIFCSFPQLIAPSHIPPPPPPTKAILQERVLLGILKGRSTVKDSEQYMAFE